MIKRLKSLYLLLLLCLFTSCLKEEKVIVTDFDYVKLTETTKTLSAFYCKGVIRGMPFSYSTNDNFYADTFFPKASNLPSANMQGVDFGIGNFGKYMPIWIYFESKAYSLTDFIQKLKTATELPITESMFHIWLYAQYTNQYTSTARYFNCCENINNQGALKITNVEYFNDYTAVTFQFTGKLYSHPSGGDSLYFGDASVEMRIRIDP